MVEGTIEQREFTPKDGAKRVVNEIIVRHCHLIAPARGVVSSACCSSGGPQNAESIPDPEGAPLSHDEDWPVR